MPYEDVRLRLGPCHEQLLPDNPEQATPLFDVVAHVLDGCAVHRHDVCAHLLPVQRNGDQLFPAALVWLLFHPRSSILHKNEHCPKCELTVVPSSVAIAIVEFLKSILLLLIIDFVNFHD